MKLRHPITSFLLVFSLSQASLLHSQSPAILDTTEVGETVTVIAGPEYDKGGLYTFFFGTGYRTLWTTPIRVEVLDLENFAGGLTFVEGGGGEQTQSIEFRGADGREYNFRSINKDPSAILPPELRGTVADEIVQDQTSAANPAGPLLAVPFLDAVGVLNAQPRLFVMPDSPRLGEFQDEFAGMLGTLEERPDEDPGYLSAVKITGSDEFLENLEESPEDRPDVRAFLAARLVDILIGDWDRHRGQWRWARFKDDPPFRWRPVPRDRDQAFVKYNGLLLEIARVTNPQLVDFESSYPGMVGLNWNGRELDRRILMELDKAAWDSVVFEVQRRITDSVIDASVATLPVRYRNVIGIPFARILRERRDHLPEAADEFYRILSGEVDVHATDVAESLVIDRRNDGITEVKIHEGTGAGKSAEPYYRRRFDRDETSELRIFLHGGDDYAVVRGPGSGIELRILGGGDLDTVVDSSEAGGILYYGSEQDEVGPGIDVETSEWELPEPANPEEEAPLPPRDWGHDWAPAVWAGGGPGVGLFLGGGVTYTDFGFRKVPWARRFRLRAGYATGAKTFRADFRAEFRRENSRVYTRVDALASGIEVLYFYGFGNETPGGPDEDFFRVDQNQFSVGASLVIPTGEHAELAFGPQVKYSTTDVEDPRLISLLEPYGSDDFGQVGARASFQFDTRDVPAAARKGIFLDLGGGMFPPVWSVDELFGEVHGEVSTYLSTGAIPLKPTLALRVGGKKVWGRFPYQEAAFIGDLETVRLTQKNRYAGDASVFGNAELRLEVSDVFLVLPGRFGVFGLADAGRVYLDGESSDEWHTAYGGGIWMAFLSSANTVRLAVVQSEGRTGLYAGAGFAF